MSWTQIINNAAVPSVFLTLVAVALAGQVISLRVISLSLLCALVGGAYGAKAALELLHSDGLPVALLAGSIAGSVIGALGAMLDAVFRGNSRALALLGSLGLLKVTQGVITLSTGGGVQAFGARVNGALQYGALLGSPVWLPYGLFIAVSAVLIHWWFLRSTQIGAAAVAIGDDPWLAAIFGIPVTKVQILTQGVGGAIAGVAGVVMALDSGLRPDLGFNIMLKAFGVLIIAKGRYLLLFPWILGLVALEQIVGYRWGGQLQEAAGLVFLSIVLITTRGLEWNSRRAPGRPSPKERN